MSAAADLARQLQTTDRSVRRAVDSGLIRGTRPSPRKLVIPARERVYLIRYWPLLSTLRRALRTEPNVAFAAVYGSIARGDADEDSDIDLLVDLRHDDSDAAAALRRRLERVTGRQVGLAHLSHTERDAPLLLAAVLQDGRVIVDRSGTWDALHRRRPQIEKRASRSFSRQMHETQEALDRLNGRVER